MDGIELLKFLQLLKSWWNLIIEHWKDFAFVLQKSGFHMGIFVLFFLRM